MIKVIKIPCVSIDYPMIIITFIGSFFASPILLIYIEFSFIHNYEQHHIITVVIKMSHLVHTNTFKGNLKDNLY